MTEEYGFTLDNPDGTPGEPVRRKAGRPKLTEEQKAERNRKNVRDWRWKHRQETLSRMEQEQFAKSRFGILIAHWTREFDALPPDEQQRINDLHFEARAVLKEASDVIAGIASNKEPGRNMPFPDLSYRLVTDFVSKTGIGNSWSDLHFLTVLEPADSNSLTADDEPLNKYGRFTKIPSLIYSQFVDAVWQWIQANRADCEPDIYNELERKHHKAVTTPESAELTLEITQ